MSMTRTFAVATPVVLLMLGGGIQMGRPLPPAQVQLSHQTLTLPGTLPVKFPTAGQSAVGEMSLGVAAETPNQEPVPIASLTKIMTAYLLLQARPLAVGEDGPITTVTAADVAEYEKDLKLGYSVCKVKVGDKLTQRQMLEALMLPSGDNIATMIAQQLAGSESAFADKMNAAAQALGMTQTHYEEASGVSARTVSTAHDQLLLAQAAMQDRTFREVVRMPQATMPSAGTVYNVNFMVGKQGISGIKTGSTLAAGSCFVGSYPITVGGKPRIMLAAVLGQISLKEAITRNAALLHQAAPHFKVYPVPAKAEGLARLTTPWKEQAGLEPAQPLKVFGYPGMPIQVEGKLTQAGLPIMDGQAVATLSFTTGRSTETMAMHAKGFIEGPDPMWRVLH